MPVELDRLQREHEEEILTMQNDFQTAEILKKLLKRQKKLLRLKLLKNRQLKSRRFLRKTTMPAT